MKKIILSVALAATVAGVAAFAWQSHGQAPLSDVELENIEALTRGEETNSGKTCYKTITTKESSKILYCGDCNWLDNSAAAEGSQTGIC